MAPNLGPNASLGYTPFEYWKGPKPVLPRPKRKSRAVALDLEPLLPTPTLAEKPSAAARWPGQRPPAGVFVAQPGTYGVSPNNNNGSTPFSEILVVPPKVLVHPLFRDEIKTPEWPRAFSPYPGSMNDSDCNGTMDDYGFPNERLAQKTAWWNPKGWTKRIWAGLAAVVVVIIVIAVAVTVTQNNKNRYPDYSKLSYKLSDTYSGENFFDKFDYFNTYDPTGGMVHYVAAEEAASRNLTYATSDTAVLRVDHTTGNTSTPDASTGRFSVRVESKTQYDKGLFIFDVKHTPYGCASWPALWFSDPNNWPDAGEIDVMEAINQGTDGNQMTLHTTSGCDMDVKRKQTGTALQSDCKNSTNGNAGCGVEGSVSTYGTNFNDGGGGYMAMEWRDEGIRVWQFARSSVPSDITNQSPDPSGWGNAMADFPNTACDMSSHFKNQSLIINIDVCGSLVEAKYADSGCGGSSCSDFQANNPDAFKTAYWEFGAFHFYTAS
ncbi:Putative glycoside hydrolase family 16, concanavalin A-like lectin/glucanase domain superfamily [Colletotrichum destructivum]|uniref:endo-1,3(4)-beta-glucanase n=1 Tax=Colletotrichum destructivum TaxID=34406 RepID=A0AAX4IA39_9PEZI|nr:Putative glycoside hydrolase family 16, concanavalin A-like lectin/glucanase domain superfamily [Colletotrichum destructivum]